MFDSFKMFFFFENDSCKMLENLFYVLQNNEKTRKIGRACLVLNSFFFFFFVMKNTKNIENTKLR